VVSYVTLSHCWGEHTPIRLFQHNITSFKEGIKVNELSPVFRSSLHVAKHFGIRYIWIDSLCIIQDSKVDWEQESSKMGEIYSGSICNLTATARPDGTESLFSVRSHWEISPLIIPMGTKYFDLQDPNFWQIEVEESPSCKRAWVFQERFLAPRNLHFGARQLFWECDCCLACEMYPTSVPDIIRKESHVRLPSMIEDVSGTWQSLVRMYSATSLTYDTDRLVAFSGIAKKFMDGHKDEYLAGLWVSKLDAQLLWQVDQRYTSRRMSSYVAPSWSWASVTGRLGGEIQDLETNTVTLIDILRTSVNVSQRNPLGVVSGGALRIQAHLAWAEIQYSQPRSKTDLYKFYLETGKGLVELMSKNRVGIGLFLDIVPANVHIPRLACVPIRSGKLQEDREPGVQGLLLEACDGPFGRFQRFGCFELKGVRLLELFSDACRYFDCRSDQGGLKYAHGGKGAQKYNITII